MQGTSVSRTDKIGVEGQIKRRLTYVLILRNIEVFFKPGADRTLITSRASACITSRHARNIAQLAAKKKVDSGSGLNRGSLMVLAKRKETC